MNIGTALCSELTHGTPSPTTLPPFFRLSGDAPRYFAAFNASSADGTPKLVVYFMENSIKNG